MRFSITAALLIFCGALLASPKAEVKFVSPCECVGNHGVARWAAKTDIEQPPQTDWVGNIMPVTPTDMMSWPPPKKPLTEDSPRTDEERVWYELTGRINTIKVEADGDIHIELTSNGGSVVVEIPLGPDWCKLRTRVLGLWIDQTWPFTIESDKVFKLSKDAPKLITVVGKAFYDIDHVGKIPNRRLYDENMAVWEIHPVMELVDVNK